MLAEGTIGAGIAIDDYVAVHFIDNKIHDIVRINPQAHAYFVSKSSDGTIKEEIAKKEGLIF